MLDQASTTFDTGERDAIVIRIHEHVVDNAYWPWVVHDANPHALRPEVQGFAQAKSWYQDIAQVFIPR